MKSRVSLQDIADQAGVHVSTASLAMRDDARLPAATRARIRAVADQLGYKTNPLVRAWMQQVRQPERSTKGAGLALLSANPPETTNLLRAAFYQNMILGAKTQASELGYGMTEWCLSNDSETPESISRTLKYRGIRGVVLFDPAESISTETAQLFAEGFATVVMLRAGGGLPFHRVSTDGWGNMVLAIDTLRARGYRRIGCASGSKNRISFNRAITSAFLLAQSQWPESERVPLLARTPFSLKGEAVVDWYRRHRPDAIISLAQDHHFELREAGVKMPEETLFCLFGAEANRSLPGLDSRALEVGRTAVFKLAGLITSNRIGLPDVPLITSVPGVWREAETQGVINPEMLSHVDWRDDASPPQGETAPTLLRESRRQVFDTPAANGAPARKTRLKNAKGVGSPEKRISP
jgi:DNA-binding LacI/PurR family transcriptional regulator